MNKWELALNKFIKPWQAKPDVVGAILTGSHAIGVFNKQSDVDVMIILADKVTWRERGNVIIDGCLIEYFANPLKQLTESTIMQFKQNSKVDATMCRIGKVLFDKDGSVKKLLKLNKSYYMKKFPPVSAVNLEMMKYTIWDYLDNLKGLARDKSKNFNLLYYVLLEKIFENYRLYLGVQLLPTAKLVKLLSDKKYSQKYGFNGWPDKTFAKMFLACLEFKTYAQGLSQINKLSNYTLKKLGGFKIDGWKVRTPLNK